MASSVFDFKDYKAYLAQALPSTGADRGSRAKLALHLKCGTSFVSQVLKGHVHFSLEQAVEISRFLRHSEAESHFFMLLIHLGRAGSPSLRSYYEAQIRNVIEERRAIQSRIETKRSLSTADQAIYYSEWFFTAVHVLVSIPQLRTRAAISRHLGLSPEIVSRSLDFLCASGLVRQEGDRFLVGERRIHIGAKSPWVTQHHTNWRLRALQEITEKREESLHFTSIMAIAEKDFPRIRAIILEAIESAEKVVQPSVEESAFCLAMDLFRV